MEVVIVNEQELARLGADIVADAVRASPETVLGLATGSSPLGLYAELRRDVAAGRLSLARCTAFTLDEYVGLPPDHAQLYWNVIASEFAATDLSAENLHAPAGRAPNLVRACADYERSIADAGGIDVQILGIGTDGHIAFNEPGSSLASRTRIKTLTKQTRSDNARFFGDDPEAVPAHCITQGIGTIMEARHLVLIASGRAKADAVHHMVEGPVTAMWPSSALQWHAHVTVLVDDAAASRLQLASYYREAYANKPAWQRF